MPESAPIPNPAAPPARKSLYIPSLDGIRAVSFMLVFVAHAGLEDKIPGGLGVTIFFFLSGYLITTLLRTEADQTGTISIRDFYIRRVLRIFPPFYLVILLGVLLHWSHLLPGRIAGEGVLFQSVHLANYWTIHRQTQDLTLDGIPLGSNVLWSLAVEEHFYLLFPLLYVILRKSFSRRGQTALLAIVCCLMLLWRCILVYHFHAVWVDPDGSVQNSRTFFATDTRADSILWGCIFAIACNPVLDKPMVLGFRLFGLFAAALLVLAATLVIRNPDPSDQNRALAVAYFRETFRYTIHGLVLFPIFAAVIVYHQSPIFRWLNFGWIKRLGVLSYSLYLIHYTVIYLVRVHLFPVELRGEYVAAPGFKGVLQGVLALAMSLAISAAIYRWVERPCAQLRKRFSHASGAAGAGKTLLSDGPGKVMPLPTTS